MNSEARHVFAIISHSLFVQLQRDETVNVPSALLSACQTSPGVWTTITFAVRQTIDAHGRRSGEFLSPNPFSVGLGRQTPIAKVSNVGRSEIRQRRCSATARILHKVDLRTTPGQKTAADASCSMAMQRVDNFPCVRSATRSARFLPRRYPDRLRRPTARPSKQEGKTLSRCFWLRGGPQKTLVPD